MKKSTEFRVFGPPGTGKTTYLVNQIRGAGQKHGYNKLFVASFTRAAAREISARAMGELNIREGDEPNFGTLHAHGYHAIGVRGKLAENMIKEWNAEYAQYQLSGEKQSDVDEVFDMSSGATAADDLYGDMMMNRALMIPVERWRTPTRAFAAKWQSWKISNGIIDYTDMLEIPLRDVERAPGNPVVGMLDEAQDASPLQMALFRKWGAHMDYIVLAGDDDQAIFTWAGARPEVMIEGDFAEKRVLAQSFRVPRAVHAAAQGVIEAVKGREPKEYRARDFDGEVRRLAAVNLRMPEKLVDDVERVAEDGKKVMILASCSYMLDGVIKELRKRGLPFHNPYRVKNGAWNPLRGSDARGVGSVDRLIAFAEQAGVDYTELMAGMPHGEPLLRAAQMLQWYEVLKATGNIPRGKRDALVTALEALAAESFGEEFIDWPDGSVMQLHTGAVGLSQMWDYISPESKFWAAFGNPEKLGDAARWLLDNVTAPKAKAMQFPVEVLCRRGIRALTEKPQIVVGTIHSVKGGEADCVYVAPDVSYAGYVGICSRQAERDAAARLKYVAYTRARESLILLEPFSNFTM